MKNQTVFFSMGLQTCGCAVWYTHYNNIITGRSILNGCTGISVSQGKDMGNGCKNRRNGKTKNVEIFI